MVKYWFKIVESIICLGYRSLVKYISTMQHLKQLKTEHTTKVTSKVSTQKIHIILDFKQHNVDI